MPASHGVQLVPLRAIVPSTSEITLPGLHVAQAVVEFGENLFTAQKRQLAAPAKGDGIPAALNVTLPGGH